MTSSEGLPIRAAARALIVDRTGRVLLFRADVAGRRPWWFAPGGTLDPGETYEAAVIREVMEETGLVVDIAGLSAPVWIRDVAFLWNGILERHVERYFLMRVENDRVNTSRLDPLESGALRTHRWWWLAEIRDSSELFAPADLGALLGPLLQGQVPPSPVLVRE